MQIILPKNVNKIIHVLEEHGFQAYAVGGCIRDSLLGRTPHDWDITTSALPEQVKALFKKTRRYGNPARDRDDPSGRGGLRGDDLPTGRGI